MVGKFNMWKKAISPIVSVSLLLFVAVVSFTGISNWSSTFQDQMTFKAEGESGELKPEIMFLTRVSDNLSIVMIKNPSKNYIVLDEISLDGVVCDIVYSNVVENFEQIHIECDVVIGQTYDIDVVSTLGVNSKLVTVVE
jgi:hypothetical protein